MGFPSGLSTAGRKMKVILAKDFSIHIVILVGCPLEISRSQRFIPNHRIMWNKGNGVSFLLLLVSFGYLYCKTFKLKTVFIFMYSAEHNTDFSLRAIGTAPQVGKLKAWWLQMSKVTETDNSPNPVFIFSLLHMHFHCNCAYILVTMLVKVFSLWILPFAN